MSILYCSLVRSFVRRNYYMTRNLTNAVDYLTIPSPSQKNDEGDVVQAIVEKKGSQRERKRTHLYYRSQLARSAYSTGVYRINDSCFIFQHLKKKYFDVK